jgi:hypothetical protein
MALTLVGIGLAVRGQRTVDDQLTVRCQRTRHLRTHLTAHTVNRLGHAVVASYVGHPFAQVLILGADHRGACMVRIVLTLLRSLQISRWLGVRSVGSAPGGGDSDQRADYSRTSSDAAATEWVFRV